MFQSRAHQLITVPWGPVSVLHGSPVLSLIPAILPGFRHVLEHILFLIGRPLMASSSAATVVLCDSSILVLWDPTQRFLGVCGPHGCQVITAYVMQGSGYPPE